MVDMEASYVFGFHITMKTPCATVNGYVKLPNFEELKKQFHVFTNTFFFVYIDKISVASSSVEPGEPLSITWQLHTVRVSTFGYLTYIVIT